MRASLTSSFDEIREFVCGVTHADKAMARNFRQLVRDAVPSHSKSGKRAVSMAIANDCFDDLLVALGYDDPSIVHTRRDRVLASLNDLEKLII